SCCGALSVTFLIWNDPTSRTLVTLTVTPGTPSVSGTMVAGLLVISPKSQPSVGVGSVTVHTDPVGKPPIVVDADRSSVTPMARSYDETTPSSVQLTWRVNDVVAPATSPLSTLVSCSEPRSRVLWTRIEIGSPD